MDSRTIDRSSPKWTRAVTRMKKVRAAYRRHGEGKRFELAVDRFREAVECWDSLQLLCVMLAGWNDSTKKEFDAVRAAMERRPKWQA